MAIAQRVRQHMQAASWIRGMFEEGIQLKQQYGADNVYDFSLGNPVLEPPPQFYEALHQLVTHPQPGMHRYMPNVGYPETRAAIAAQLTRETGMPFTANHIVMVVGAAGGLNVVLKTLLDPGDEVMIFAPYFVEYHFYVENHQGVSKVVPTDAQFTLDLEAIAQALATHQDAPDQLTEQSVWGSVSGGDASGPGSAVAAEASGVWDTDLSRQR